MTTLVLEHDPMAVDVSVTAQHLDIALTDGRRMLIPLAWYPRLMLASRLERQNLRILGNGYAIEWPDLDEHIGVEGLLAGHSSGESADSFNRWLSSRTKSKKTKKPSSVRKPLRKKATKS